MYYRLDYREGYFSWNGIILFISQNISVIGFILCNYYYISNWNVFFLMIFFTFQLTYLCLLFQENFKNYYRLMLIFVFLVGTVFYILIYLGFQLFELKWVIFVIIIVIIAVEMCLIFLLNEFLRKGKINYTIEINDSQINKYIDQKLSENYIVEKLKRVLFVHETILIVSGGGWDVYNVNFEFIKDENLKVEFPKKNEKLVQFLKFLKNFCSSSDIEFTKITKCGNRENKIDNLDDYLKIDKKKRLLEAIECMSAGLLISNLIMIPIIIALINTGLEKEIPEYIIIAYILISIFFLIAPILFVCSLLLYRKYYKTSVKNKIKVE